MVQCFNLFKFGPTGSSQALVCDLNHRTRMSHYVPIRVCVSVSLGNRVSTSNNDNYYQFVTKAQFISIRQKLSVKVSPARVYVGLPVVCDLYGYKQNKIFKKCYVENLNLMTIVLQIRCHRVYDSIQCFALLFSPFLFSKRLGHCHGSRLVFG